MLVYKHLSSNTNPGVEHYQDQFCWRPFVVSLDWQLKGSAQSRPRAKQCRHDNRKVTALLLLCKLKLQHKIAFA